MIALSLSVSLLRVSPAFALDTGDIVVASIRGEVHFVVGGSERPLRVGAALEPPATVRTGHDGAVELKQGATSVSVGPDTLLEFPALAQRGGAIDRIVQSKGNAFYDVGKREGRKLRVETPYLVGVVKGTQFNVAARDAGATISLFEGLLEIRAADESSVVDIKAGEVASRNRGEQGISVIKMDSKAPPAQRPAASPARPAPMNVDGDSLLAGRDSSQPIVSEVVDTFSTLGDPGRGAAPSVPEVKVVPAVEPMVVPVQTSVAPVIEDAGPVNVVVTTPVIAPPVVSAPLISAPVDTATTVTTVGVGVDTTVGGVDLSTGTDLSLGTDDSGNNGNGNAGSKSSGNGTGNSGNGDNSNHGREDDGVRGLANKK